MYRISDDKYDRPTTKPLAYCLLLGSAAGGRNDCRASTGKATAQDEQSFSSVDFVRNVWSQDQEAIDAASQNRERMLKTVLM